MDGMEVKRRKGKKKEEKEDGLAKKEGEGFEKENMR